MKIDKILEYDIIVVGSGIGGLTAGKKASEKGRHVALVTAGTLCGGASYFPLKGTLGIQATADDKKDIELFREDIKNIGRGMENPHMIDTYITDIKKSIPTLFDIGFKPWLRNDKRPACFAKYARDIFLINEWDTARDEAKKIFSKIENLDIIENSKIIKILKYENKIIGAVFQKEDGEFFIIKSSIIIMATGGIAGLYKHNLYPSDVSGSGHVVLLDIGAKLQNMEFIQFIPAFIKPVYNTLFGEHTLKYCLGMYDTENNLLYSGIDNDEAKKIWIERSSYAPFSSDFKSSVIDLEMAKNISGVKLKFHKDLYSDEGEFYKVYLKWLKDKIGIDMCHDEIIVAPFAHSCNGGVKVDKNGETNIKGVFAIGELMSGIEGANRLGGNSVGGALVFGIRASAMADNYLKNNNRIEVSNNFLEDEFTNWINNIFPQKNIRENKNMISSDEIIKFVKNLVTEKAGIKRNGKDLKEALLKIENLKENWHIENIYDPKNFEAYFKMETAKILFTAMLARTETRGAHYREDYKESSKKIYKIIISKEDKEIFAKIENVLENK